MVSITGTRAPRYITVLFLRPSTESGTEKACDECLLNEWMQGMHERQRWSLCVVYCHLLTPQKDLLFSALPTPFCHLVSKRLLWLFGLRRKLTLPSHVLFSQHSLSPAVTLVTSSHTELAHPIVSLEPSWGPFLPNSLVSSSGSSVCRIRKSSLCSTVFTPSYLHVPLFVFVSVTRVLQCLGVSQWLCI